MAEKRDKQLCAIVHHRKPHRMLFVQVRVIGVLCEEYIVYECKFWLCDVIIQTNLRPIFVDFFSVILVWWNVILWFSFREASIIISKRYFAVRNA